MTKEHIIQILRDDYLGCIYSSAAHEESDDDEYIEGYLDGCAKGISYVIELLKQLETDTRPQTRTPTHFAKVPYAITLLQLYLSNDNWTANSVLHIIVNGVEREEVAASVAMTKYGKARIRSFAENTVYLFQDNEH